MFTFYFYFEKRKEMIKMEKKLERISIENANLGPMAFRNFSGAPTKYDKYGGKRSFNLFIDDKALAERLTNEGWNVKYPKQPEEDVDYEVLPRLTVKVNFNGVPPKIVVITNGNHVFLDEETVGMLDTADIDNVDVVISPYEYDNDLGKGVTAYLRTMYVTLKVTEFMDKYGF